MCLTKLSSHSSLHQSPSLLSPPKSIITVMEPQGLASQASWNSFNSAMSGEESDVVAQLLEAHHFSNEQAQDPGIGMPPVFWSDHDSGPYFVSHDNSNYNSYYWSQGSCSTSTVTTSTTTSATSLFLPAATNYEGYYLSDPNATPAISTSSVPMDFSVGEEHATNLSLPVGPYHRFEEPVGMIEDESSEQPEEYSKEKPSAPILPPYHTSQAVKRRLQRAGDFEKPATKHRDDNAEKTPKKKARASAPACKKAKNSQSKKAQKSVRTGNEEGNNADFNGQSCSSYSSEDDSNTSQELNGDGSPSSSSKGSAVLNANEKTRASRGSATDPQSLYARKRRERINERLRILQNLVPNGTKVDISTMLEEAVQYVKFLQLQIKLLSSDELWMYAPIAYNGINIGLDLKISPPQP